VQGALGGPATWVHDFARESSARLPGVSGVKPTWLPDSRHLLVASSELDGRFSIFRRTPAGPEVNEPVLQSDTFLWPWDVSSDGAWLLYARLDPRTGEDLWLAPLAPLRGGDGGQAVVGEPFLVTDYTETNADISPDGRSVAYVSNEGGVFDLFVRALPVASGSKQQVSRGGGYQPRWRSDGRELFYFAGDGRLMSVDVTPGARPAFGSPKLLFQAPILGGGATAGNWYWDVSADGQRFLINTIEPGSANGFTVLLNWQSGLP
jgi:eukaryotic-like serine/threonine-protein kinase